jgi:o-succinylbenzoate synthase
MSGRSASFLKHTLRFKKPSGTSRGILHTKDSWFLILTDEEGKTGIGECSLIPGLSPDPPGTVETMLDQCCNEYGSTGKVHFENLTGCPAVAFAAETALADLHSDKERILYPSKFTNGEASIPINGLIWMGDAGFMKKQIREKLDAGFSCLKLKIGAINFEVEISLLQSVRNEFTSSEVELRVDANGAFFPEEALEKLTRLAELDLHSIEQPIQPGHFETMAKLCAESPLPIALDEELIGVNNAEDQKRMLAIIQPQYIILKPSLLGGIRASETWIRLAEERNIGWWVTSALESNIGLNAIAQWAYTLNNPLPQGLGTGQLYSNNIVSPLYVIDGTLGYDTTTPWKIEILKH